MLSQRSPFVLAAHQKYTRETRLGGQISALQRIETTSCAIRAEGHLNATVRGSYCGIAPIPRNLQSNPRGVLWTSDCVAEREGFEPSVQVLARTTV